MTFNLYIEKKEIVSMINKQYMIDEDYHYDDNYFRMITVSLARVLNSRVRWINRFENKKMRVLLPFYVSMGGQERFLLDAFVDDIPNKRVELDTTQKQRGIITFNGVTSNDDQFANPHQYLSKKTKINDKMRTVWSRTKAVPVTTSFDVKIRLDNEGEIMTCVSRLLDTLYNYYFSSFDYFGQKIDLFFKLPADKSIEIIREQNLTSDITPTISMPLEIETYYPIFKVNTEDCEICDNDDKIDWNFLGVDRPTENSKDCDGLKRVYWYNNFIDGKTKKEIIEEKLRDKNLDSDIIE